jgi:transposase
MIQRHELTDKQWKKLKPLLPPQQPETGRPKQKPDRVVGDRGYSYKDNRAYLRRRGIRHTIPRRPDHQRRGPFNKTYYKMRNRVERLINRLKQFRRIATRYEKLAENYLAMLHIGSILLWL